MPFVPNSEHDRKAMLEVIGKGSVEELFSDIPASRRFPPLDLPKGLSEMEVLKELRAMAAEELASIEAALNPPTTPFIFFVADGTGGHAFAETLAEHNANVAKWRQIEAERERQQPAQPSGN